MGQNRQGRPESDVAPHKNFANEPPPAVGSCLDAWYLRFPLDPRKRFDAWVPIAITLAEPPSQYAILALQPATQSTCHRIDDTFTNLVSIDEHSARLVPRHVRRLIRASLPLLLLGRQQLGRRLRSGLPAMTEK